MGMALSYLAAAGVAVAGALMIFLILAQRPNGGLAGAFGRDDGALGVRGSATVRRVTAGFALGFIALAVLANRMLVG